MGSLGNFIVKTGVLTSPQQNAVKGLLILLVVFGHMHIVQFQFRPLYNLIYTFHVAAFLILPFLQTGGGFSWGLVKRRLVRYMVPFVWFFTFATVIFSAVYLLPKGMSVLEILQRYLIGLATASTRTLDAASGLKLLWFLPALFSLVILKSLYTSYPRARLAILTLCILANLFAGEFGPWRYYIPMGALIAAYVFPVGLTVFALFRTSYRYGAAYRALLVVLSPLSLALAWQTGVSMNLGDLTLYGIHSNPGLWFVANFAMASTTLAILLLGPVWALISPFKKLGAISLAIYLLHGFVNQAFELTTHSRLQILPWQYASIQFLTVVYISTLAAHFMLKYKVFRFIFFPRRRLDFQKWIQYIQKKLKFIR